MGDATGKKCIPHLSGGFGFIYMLHLVSAMPTAGPHIEFKGYAKIPIECETSPLRVEGGKIKVPTGPGIGVEIDFNYSRVDLRWRIECSSRNTQFYPGCAIHQDTECQYIKFSSICCDPFCYFMLDGEYDFPGFSFSFEQISNYPGCDIVGNVGNYQIAILLDQIRLGQL